MFATIITLIFLGSGLIGSISGLIIIIFVILYVAFVVSSYYLAKDNNDLPPKATIEIIDGKDTFDNLDEGILAQDEDVQFHDSPKQDLFGFENYKVNVMSLERNSITPVNYFKEYLFVLIYF